MSWSFAIFGAICGGFPGFVAGSFMGNKNHQYVDSKYAGELLYEAAEDLYNFRESFNRLKYEESIINRFDDSEKIINYLKQYPYKSESKFHFHCDIDGAYIDKCLLESEAEKIFQKQDEIYQKLKKLRNSIDMFRFFNYDKKKVEEYHNWLLQEGLKESEINRGKFNDFMIEKHQFNNVKEWHLCHIDENGELVEDGIEKC